VKRLHFVAVMITLALAGVSAYWLTRSGYEGPCATTQDITAAAMAEDGSDQDVLVDHAMIERRNCAP